MCKYVKEDITSSNKIGMATGYTLCGKQSSGVTWDASSANESSHYGMLLMSITIAEVTTQETKYEINSLKIF